jgi:hypothetical protein
MNSNGSFGQAEVWKQIDGSPLMAHQPTPGLEDALDPTNQQGQQLNLDQVASSKKVTKILIKQPGSISI